MARRTASTRSPAGPSIEDRIVLLIGKEEYLRRAYTDQLKRQLADAGTDADAIRFDGASASLADVLDECRSVGLMVQHKFVIVDNADAFVKGDNRPAMERYAAAPAAEATLVLRSETWHKGKLDKLIEDVGSIIKCDSVKPDRAAQAAREMATHRHQRDLDVQAARALIDRVGVDLSRIASEVAKLASAVDEGQPITMELVRDMVGPSREEQFWLIQDVLLQGNPEAALGKLHELITVSRVDLVPLRWAFVDLARKVHGASQGLAVGEAPGAISSRLRLWGPAGSRLLDVAKHLSPARARRLLRDAIETDMRGKTGQGDELRGLEVLAIQFAQAIRA
ncbi:MAG: DNA polymerase III subunit delta [Phycisphaerales bacterium]|nr:DNA polymerase III subunit delta [Phycisphaerales bacterium]